jgi:hypothetical protein
MVIVTLSFCVPERRAPVISLATPFLGRRVFFFPNSKHACTRKSQTFCLPRCLNTTCTMHHLVWRKDIWRTAEACFMLFETWRNVNPSLRKYHPDLRTASVKYTLTNIGLSYKLPINRNETTDTKLVPGPKKRYEYSGFIYVYGYTCMCIFT